MSEEMLIRYCAPTLASIKTGSMFSCPFADCGAMYDHVRNLNRRLKEKGLRVLPLRYSKGKGLIYVYRPCRLCRDLQDNRACSLLENQGYKCGNHNCCVIQLMWRLRQSEDFPHEIGLFLGYPPEDVHGFIHNKGQAKFTGCWKVYGDVESARRTFAQYKKCTDVYMKHWQQGRQIEKLAVNRKSA